MNKIVEAGYFWDKGYLCQQSNKKPISNFCIVPVKTYCLNDETIPRFADIAIVKDGSRIPLPLAQRMELSHLNDKWWKNPPPGCCFHPDARNPAKHLKTLFHLLLSNTEMETVFQLDTLGWRTLPPASTSM